ncbi:Protein-tyrosine phosphatase, low molecular weight [Syntrophobacter sp. SbD2]|nr:Protein-tyrosine phosphatase, low molecular weight [Syntrophobacter sp. SbD2]
MSSEKGAFGVEKPMKRVLFLCYGNACRSIMAEALARHFWGEGMEACSAGLMPLGYIPSETLEALREAGISTDGLYSKGLSEAHPADIDYLVNLTQFEVGPFIPPVFRGKLILFPVRDPFGQGIESYRKVREELKGLVRQKLPGLIGAVNSE